MSEGVIGTTRPTWSSGLGQRVLNGSGVQLNPNMVGVNQTTCPNFLNLVVKH